MVKVLVSLDEKLLKKIDREAGKRGLSRSAYLAALAEHDMARTYGPGASDQVRQALVRLGQLFSHGPSEDSTTVIRVERDTR